MCYDKHVDAYIIVLYVGKYYIQQFNPVITKHGMLYKSEIIIYKS